MSSPSATVVCDASFTQVMLVRRKQDRRLSKRDEDLVYVLKDLAETLRGSAVPHPAPGHNNQSYRCVLDRTREWFVATAEVLEASALALSEEYSKGPSEPPQSFMNGLITIQPASKRTALEDQCRHLVDGKLIAARIDKHIAEYVIDMKETLLDLKDKSELTEWEQTLDEARAWIALLEKNALLPSLIKSINNIRTWKDRNMTTLKSVTYVNPAYTEPIDHLKATQRTLLEWIIRNEDYSADSDDLEEATGHKGE